MYILGTYKLSSPGKTIVNTKHFNDSRWVTQRILPSGSPSTPSENFTNYVRRPPPDHTEPKGTMLLMHSYPQCSYQSRHVIMPIADAGYTVIAPGPPQSWSLVQVLDGYEKAQMAADIHKLLTEHLGINELVDVVGHDIDGMIAHAYASRFAKDTASVAPGEFPMPGLIVYDNFCRENPGLWHFQFHWQANLPELLTQGRERQYIKHFYDRWCIKSSAISPADVDYHANMFGKTGGMRARFGIYRTFHKDVEGNHNWVTNNSKYTVYCMSLNGEGSFLASIAEEQNLEVYEATEAAIISGSRHWCAEENPGAFTQTVIPWARKDGRLRGF